jgi:hypothetical protein
MSASAEDTESAMYVLWWFVGVVLIAFSLLLWVAGLTGREGVLRIGKKAVAEGKEESKAGLRSVNAFNIVVGIAGVLVGLAVILVLAI